MRPIFALLLLSMPALAQTPGPGASGSGETAPKSRYAIAVGYSLEYAGYRVNDGDLSKGEGEGVMGGLEFGSTSSWPKGLWNLGVYYLSYELRMAPNGAPERNAFRAIEVPLTWGFYLNRRFLFSLGVKGRYGLDSVRRRSALVNEEISHKEFGIGASQLFGLASLRYYHFIARQPRVFLDARYGYGLFDRALGEKDRWRDSTSQVLMGVNF